MDFKKIEKELEEAFQEFDKSPPIEIAREYVRSKTLTDARESEVQTYVCNAKRVLYESYISMQPKERADSIRKHINDRDFSLDF